ncbi:hypothetical protein [Campylobacter sp.]|nr:hypothetical protein [Campylobacter sp.]MDD7741565.1 hypothetical protein [Campylobacteraceae bacterium]MDY3246392.1 hypothetical protein [Campylobacter sp.]MDY4121025.1 hypothetical protein [Campylobacter sp.]
MILAMFFALAQARVSISTPNVFIDSHYYKKKATKSPQRPL